jgi:hypothetical protein
MRRCARILASSRGPSLAWGLSAARGLGEAASERRDLGLCARARAGDLQQLLVNRADRASIPGVGSDWRGWPPLTRLLRTADSVVIPAVNAARSGA